MSSKQEREEAKAAKEPRSGSVAPADAEFARWLQGLWAKGESPQKIHLVQWDRQGRAFGPIVKAIIIKKNEKWDVEQCVALGEQIAAAAQLDCTRVAKRPQTYIVAAYDEARAPAPAEPFDRWPLEMKPRNVYDVTATEKQDALTAVSGDGDLPLEERNLALAYLVHTIKSHQFDKTAIDAQVGDLFILYRDELASQRQWNQELLQLCNGMLKDRIQAVRDVEAAMSDAEGRKRRGKWEDFKLDALRDMLRQGKNLLPGLFGPPPNALPANGTAGANGANGTAGAAAATRSREQMILDNFLADCESTGVTVRVFGDWDPESAKCKTPGILSADQFYLIARVHKGILPPGALFDLMPDSGKPVAISMAQQAALRACLTEGTALSLGELIAALAERKEAEEKAAATQATKPQPQPQGA